MYKYIIVIQLILLSHNISAQQKLPTIKANSTKLNICVDDVYFAKDECFLDTTKNPDVLSIGSKWFYKTKKVTFKTDIDSITINIKPDSKFNFTVILNARKICNFQISTSANPIFLNYKILSSLLFGLLTIFFLIYYYKEKIDFKLFLYFGYASMIVFWSMTFLCGSIHGNYNHFKNTISDLGEIGSKSEMLTSIILVILSVLCSLFSIGFYKSSKKLHLSIIPSILSFSMPISILWAAIFSSGNALHDLNGPLPFLIIIAFILSYFKWKKIEAIKSLRNISLFCFCISMLILLRFIKPFGFEYEGLIQRFFYVAWSIWTSAITYSLLKIKAY